MVYFPAHCNNQCKGCKKIDILPPLKEWVFSQQFHKLLCLLILILCSSCYNHKYPNGDGTMTVVEYCIFKKDSTIFYNVKCPINYRGVIKSCEKGHHYVGVPGKGGHSVTHYDIEIVYNSQYIYKDRISRCEYEDMMKRGYPIICEKFYPRHRIYPIY